MFLDGVLGGCCRLSYMAGGPCLHPRVIFPPPLLGSRLTGGTAQGRRQFFTGGRITYSSIPLTILNAE